MPLIEIDFTNKEWPVVRDWISLKLYERFCNDTTLLNDYHEMLLKQRNITYSPVKDKNTLVEIDIDYGTNKYKELVTINMFLRMHKDATLKNDWKEMLLLKMNIKRQNNDDINESIYTDENSASTETQLSQCSGSNSSSSSFMSTVPASDDIQWPPKKTWFFIEERFKREKKFQDPKSHVDKYWNEILQIMINNGYVECKEKGTSGLKIKFKNLMVTYRRNVDKRRKKTGESSVKWPYFDRFDEVYGEKNIINPPSTHLGSTLIIAQKRKKEKEIELTSENKENEDEQNPDDPSVDVQFTDDEMDGIEALLANETNTVRIKKKRLSANERMVQFLDKSLQVKMEQWQEKKALKEQQNKALIYVGDCIKCLHDKK